MLRPLHRCLALLAMLAALLATPAMAHAARPANPVLVDGPVGWPKGCGGATCPLSR
jgi:hypothetical protein